MTAPAALPENTGLAFVGEMAWAPAVLTEREAEKLTTAANACGRPNSDVLRQRLAIVRGQPTETWQIDFPDHFTGQEAALYEQPFVLLRGRSPDATWLNPHAHPSLRRALARVSRFLAMPTDSAAPDWRWIEEDPLPDASLLVVARDDDFTHGLLQSDLFALWWREGHSTLPPELIVGSFPFPWPPATPLSALTAVQEEHRHAIARAIRGGAMEQLNSVVLAAYGWTPNLDEHALLEKLADLHRRRAS